VQFKRLTVSAQVDVFTGTAGVSPAGGQLSPRFITKVDSMQRFARADALDAGETPAVPVKMSTLKTH
jgi:hypothetical protein